MDAPAPHEPDDLDALESQLRQLKPAAPDANFQRKLGRELDSRSAERRENRVVWVRFAPLAAAACVVLAGTWLLKQHLISSAVESDPGNVATDVASIETENSTVSPEISSTEKVPRTFVSPPPISSGIPADRFVPVSSQQHFRQASPGEVIRLSDQLPAREMRLEYEDVWHWRDPETETNIRIIKPREELMLVPVDTN